MIKIILNALKKELFGIDVEFPKNVCWQEIYNEARLQAVDSLVYSGISKSGVEDKEFQEKAAYQLLKNSKTFLMHITVAKILEEANISYTIIKGVVSAYYYPDAYVRPMGDTDVLVKKEDAQKVFELFKEKGFEINKKSINVNVGHHVEFKKGIQHVELHYGLPGIPDNEMEDDVKKLTENIWDNLKVYDTIYGKITGVNEFFHGLIMLLHMQQHMCNGGMGLRHLCDWAVFVNRFTEDEFVNIFEEKLKSIGLWRFACLLSQASGYLGLEQKEWMGKEETVVQMLLEDIISCGNFGRKDVHRMNSQKYVSVVDNKEKKKSQVGQYFHYGIKTTMRIWPFYKKHKWLLPVGFIAYCVRTGYRLVTKKSKIYNLSGNDKVHDLYSQLKLFEK